MTKNAIFAGLMILVCSSLVGAIRPKQMRGKKLPAINGYALDGRPINSRFFEGKVTLICFMYIGCPPCMEELPMLRALYLQADTAHFQVLCIAPHTKEQLLNFNATNQSLQSQVRTHFKADSILYPILAECPKTKPNKTPNRLGPECDLISRKFKVDGYPRMYLVNEKQTIVQVWEGFASGRDSLYIADIQAEVEKARKN